MQLGQYVFNMQQLNLKTKWSFQFLLSLYLFYFCGYELGDGSAKIRNK